MQGRQSNQYKDPTTFYAPPHPKIILQKLAAEFPYMVIMFLRHASEKSKRTRESLTFSSALFIMNSFE